MARLLLFFAYLTTTYPSLAQPISLSSASPREVSISEIRELPYKVLNSGNVIPLANTENLTLLESSNTSVAIFDLDRFEIVDNIQLGFHPIHGGFSPDNKRLFIVGSKDLSPPYKAELHAVVDVESGNVIEIPTDYTWDLYRLGSSRRRIIWLDDNIVHFSGQQGGLDLNLETLEVKTPGKSVKRPSLPRSWGIKYDTIEKRTGLVVYDKNFTNVLDWPVDKRAALGLSHDNRYIIYQSSNNFIYASNKTTVATLQAIKSEPIIFDLDVRSDNLDKLVQRLKERPLFAYVYDAQKNPLNGNVIGPNKNAAKGQVELFSTASGTSIGARVSYLYLKKSINTGDVISSLYGVVRTTGAGEVVRTTSDQNSWGVLSKPASPRDSSPGRIETRGDESTKNSTPGSRVKSNTPTSGEDEVYMIVEDMPELIGGLSSIQNKIQYPEIAKEAGIEGRVFVQFVVDKTGAVVDPVVVRGAGHGLDEEAIRVIQKATFKPGKQRGVAVNVKMSLPINFSLSNKK